MISSLWEIPSAWPVRKSRKQKKAFRKEAVQWFSAHGYACREEKGSFGARNILAGDPENAEYLITAHYDTCAIMPVPNLITPTSLFLFLLYQLFVTFLIMAAALVIALAAGWITGSVQTGFVSWMGAMYLLLGLILFGPANPSNVNDNTSGVITVMETAAALPEELRSKVCFVLFDLEEAGLLGSASYRSRHRKATSCQIVLNLDCVGEGDTLMMFPTGRLKRDKKRMGFLRITNRSVDGKQVRLWEKGFGIYPSDQANFPYGLGICAVNQSRFGFYLSRIHTPRDTMLDHKNVSILRDCLIDIVGGSAAQ